VGGGAQGAGNLAVSQAVSCSAYEGPEQKVVCWSSPALEGGPSLVALLVARAALFVVLALRKLVCSYGTQGDSLVVCYLRDVCSALELRSLVRINAYGPWCLPSDPPLHTEFIA
jgi:hypothetical protein